MAARRTRPVTVPLIPEYAAILASPIFAPDRRPGDATAATAAGGDTLAGYAALGAATGGAAASAVVSEPGGKVDTLRRGELLDGWRLIGLNKTRLSFQRNGVTRDLVVGAPAETANPTDAAATPSDSQ